MRFQDKVVIVTGSGAGIGKATALAFAREGARVIVANLHEESGGAVVREISEHTDGEGYFVQTDVSDSKSVEQMVQKTLAYYGTIDILINNAGIYQKGDVVRVSEKDWDRIMDVNLKGAYLCCHYVVPVMLERDSGIIVNVSSEAGLVGFANQVAYNVSKAGLISLTKSMAVDYGGRGIRVNAVCPGTTETPLVDKALRNEPDPEEARRQIACSRPLNRLGKPEEIAQAILVLSSDELGYATGAVLTIDGGYTAQ